MAEILARVADFSCTYVTVTGGEPLAQPECLELLAKLCDQGYRVSLETGGAMPIKDVDPRVVVILDLKTPASGESHRNLEDNIGYLKPVDEVKFVISDRKDYEWAANFVKQYNLTSVCNAVFFNPGYGALEAKELGEWILKDGLAVRLGVQLHKIAGVK